MLRLFNGQELKIEQLQYHTLVLLKCESEDVRTAVAEPEMLNSGNSEERGKAFVLRARGHRLGPKTEELASRQPTKRGGTSGVRAFRVQLLRQRLSCRLSAARRRRRVSLGA